MKELEKSRKSENFNGLERGKLIKKGLAKRRNRAGSPSLDFPHSLITENKQTCDNNPKTYPLKSFTL